MVEHTLRRWLGTAAVVAVFVGVVALSDRPAAAVPGASSSSDALLVCSGQSLDALYSETGTSPVYGWVQVPAGATASFVASGAILPSSYWGAGRGQYTMHVLVRDPETNAQLWYDWSSESTGLIFEQPYPWQPFSGRNIGSWTNNTGVNRVFSIEMWAQRTYAGADLEWSTSITVTGGSSACLSPDELAVPNLSRPNGCGAQPGAADPVNVVQGNFWDSWSDVAVPGSGPGLALSRSYSSSRAGEDGAFGFGWSWSYGMHLDESSGVAAVTQENGAVVRFYELSPGTWAAPPGVQASLVEHGGGWTMTRAGSEVFDFDTGGRLAAVANRSGEEVALVYDGAELDTVTDEAGRSLSFTWSAGRVVEVTGPDVILEGGGSPVPMVVSFGYDGSGNLTSVTGVDGGVWTYGYDVSHRMTTIREPRHHGLGGAAPVVENSYDGSGRVEWQDDREDRRTTFGWGTPGETVVTDPAGVVTVYEHEAGICTGVVVDPGPEESRWSYEVDPHTLGRTRVTDPNGVESTATYDQRGLLTSVTTARGTTTMTHDGDGLPLTVTDTLGVTTTFEYEPGSDRLASVTRPVPEGGGPLVVGYAYTDVDHPAMPTAVTDARGKTWAYQYDVAGNLVASIDPEGGETTWTYNALGWPLTSVAPAGNAGGGTPGDHMTSWAYNRAGAVVAVTDPAGVTVEHDVDLSGYLTATRVPTVTAGPVEETVFTWNAAGELVEVERPDDTTVVSEYRSDGALEVQTDPAGATTTYGYDGHGRLTSITDPDERTTELGYDPGGRVIWRQDPGGDCGAAPATGCVTFDYDVANELTGIAYSDPGTPDVTGITYDERGLRTGLTDGTGTQSWTWDSLGRLISHTNGAEVTVGYGWDLGGLLTSITYGPSMTVTRSFDDAGRLTSVTDWLGNTTSFGYDDNGNLTDAEPPTTTENVDTYGYDTTNRLTSVTWAKDVTPLGSVAYGRDLQGRLAGGTATGVTSEPSSYGYDPLGQLAEVDADAYGYDLAGNLTDLPDGRLQVFDPARQLCWSSPTASTGTCDDPAGDATVFDYDDRGNRLAVRPAGGVPTVLGYDQADRLATAEVPALSGAAGQFQAVTPSRILSTSSPVTGGCDPSPCARLSAGVPVEVLVTGVGGVPASGVASVTLAVHAAGVATGTAIVYADPSDATVPTAVGLLANAGQSVTNTVLAVPGPDGRVRLTSTRAIDLVIDVIGWHADADGQTGGLLFEPADPPARVLSTVTPVVGTCDPSPCGRFGAVSVQTVQVGGVAGVPSDGVSAVAVVAHVLDPAAVGFLSLYPTGSSFPGAAQMAYSVEARSALTIVPLGPDGAIQVFSFQAADVLLDVIGWYGPATSGEGLVAHQVESELIVDTRVPVGVCDPSPCGRLSSGVPVLVEVAGHGNIPATGVDAVALVLHAGDADPGPGSLVAWDPDETMPAVATMTLVEGDMVSGTAIVPVDGDGRIALRADVDVDVVVQTVGWYEESTRTWAYAYDADGLRASKTSPGGEATGYTWSSGTGLPLLLTEHGPEGDTHVIYGPGNLPVAQINPNDSVWWYHVDQLGSTRLLTDDDGDPVGSFTYGPYGQPVASSGVSPVLGWAGEYTDPETGFVYLRARYYDPATGQFLTRDPLEVLTRSAYDYAGGDPINTIDPSGLCPMCVVFLGGALLGGGLDLGFQMLDNVSHGCGAFSNINWTSVGVNALIGGGLSVGGELLATGRLAQAFRGINWADETGAIGRATTRWGRVVQDFRGNPGAWSQVSAHAEQATARAYRGATSIEEVFVRGNDWLVRHRVVDDAGTILHETFREIAKFGL